MKRFIVTMTGLIIALLLLVIWNVTSGSVSVDGMQMWQVLLRQTEKAPLSYCVGYSHAPPSGGSLWEEPWRYPASCSRLFSKILLQVLMCLVFLPERKCWSPWQ